MASAKNNQLISSEGPHFSPKPTIIVQISGRMASKPMIIVQISGRMASIGISDGVTTSVYSEKTRMKKLMMKMIIIIIIIIMNKSQETRVYHQCQKLTSAMKQRPEK